ncbi:MAG TPA: hypothetical protein VK207_01610 [Bacteroidales bacterium]|nr:hypothetical protein [Bacteroidales bacterium]
MIKRFLSLLIVTAFITSCGNTPKNEAASTGTEAAKVEFASLIANPGEFMGKTISVEGKVVHVCTHTGKKLFIVGENPDVRLYIQAGENMPKFPMELLGSTVVVEGTLTSAAGMPAEEGAAHEGTQMAMSHENMAADTCETATAMASQIALADVMMEYKSHIVK